MLNEYGCYYIGKEGIIELTRFENQVLYLLIKYKGRIITFNQICKVYYHQELDKHYRNAIRVRMSRLRHKLKNEVNIKTKLGMGYRID